MPFFVLRDSGNVCSGGYKEVPILMRVNGGTWKSVAAVTFNSETDLQEMLYKSPELVNEEAEQDVVFVREAGLPGGGRTDLLGVTTDGDILIIETKLANN